jgi:cell division protein FtsB
MSYNIKQNINNQDHSHLTVFFILGFFALALTINLAKHIKQYTERVNIIHNQEQELSELNKKQEKTRYQIKKSETEEYIEKKARELVYSKKDEYIIVGAYLTPTPAILRKQKPKKPNYKLWLETFIQK